AANIPPRPRQEAIAVIGAMPEDALEDLPAQQAGEAVIASEDGGRPVALVTSEDLVAAIAGHQPRHARLRGQPRTAKGPDSGIVAERLVVSGHEVRKDVEGLAGSDDVGVVGGAEVPCAELGVG